MKILWRNKRARLPTDKNHRRLFISQRIRHREPYIFAVKSNYAGQKFKGDDVRHLGEQKQLPEPKLRFWWKLTRCAVWREFLWKELQFRIHFIEFPLIFTNLLSLSPQFGVVLSTTILLTTTRSFFFIVQCETKFANVSFTRSLKIDRLHYFSRLLTSMDEILRGKRSRAVSNCDEQKH